MVEEGTGVIHFSTDGAITAVYLVRVEVWELDLVFDCSAVTIGIVPDFLLGHSACGHCKLFLGRLVGCRMTWKKIRAAAWCPSHAT